MKNEIKIYSWNLIMNSETQRISVCERVKGCKRVSLFVFVYECCTLVMVCTCVCVGRGLKIPKQPLLEMITLIKPLLSKLPPPSICSLNTPNQAQVCPDAFTPCWLTTFCWKTPDRGHSCYFYINFMCWKRQQMTDMNDNTDKDDYKTYWPSIILFFNLSRPFPSLGPVS